MAKLSIAERIAQLEARKQALQARLTKHERARDTRRKVLLGAMLLDALERHRSGRDHSEERAFASQLTDWVRRELPGFLTRPIDRTLFPEFIDQMAAPTETASAAPETPGTDTAAVQSDEAHGDASRHTNA